MSFEVRDAQEVFGDARWIWSNLQGYELTNYFMQARRVFSLKAAPRKCVIRVTADARYKLLVNGRFVASGPARGYQSHWPYDEVDIAPYLKRGQNAVAALVHSYGHGTHSYVSADAGGFILRGAAGGTDLSTGGDWRVRRAPGYRRHFTRVCTQLGYEEFFDARLDDGSWVLPTYVERGKPWTAGDTRPVDAVWRGAECRAAGVMPWPSVEPRGMAMLREEVIAPKALVAECDGASPAGWKDAANLTELYLEDRRDWREPSAKLAATKGHAALAVTRTKMGAARGFRSYVLDFGREVVGSLIIEASGAAGGEVVDTQVFETIRGLQPDVISPQLDCKMAFANRLTLEKGTTRHEQFERWGFRYAAITVRGSARTLKLKVSLRTALYPLDVKAEFRSSDRLINDIYRISVRTEECCMIDAYVDCPWREQAQWWGDARVQAANTFHLAADARVLKRGIRITAGQEVPNGLTYGMTPTVAHGCILPDYTLTWVMTLWDYYYQTGDKSIVAEQADRMRRALAYFEGVTAENGLLPYDPRYWLFLDWADIFKNGYGTVYNMLYLLALETAARLCGLIGERADEARCAAKAKALRKAIVTRLFDSRTGTFLGGLDFHGKPVKQNSPHAYALAVLAGLCPERAERFVTERLLETTRGEYPGREGDVEEAHRGRTTPSSFFMHYVFEAMKRHGRKAEVIDCIRRWWGVFVKWGLSTTPENWEYPAGWLSACHAWSAHPIIHFHNIILGVTQSDVAWKRIDFEPVFYGRGASGRTATPLGEVEVEWKRDGDTAEVRLVVPKGMTARVRLPGVRRTVRGGRHRWTVKPGETA